MKNPRFEMACVVESIHNAKRVQSRMEKTYQDMWENEALKEAEKDSNAFTDSVASKAGTAEMVEFCFTRIEDIYHWKKEYLVHYT